LRRLFNIRTHYRSGAASGENPGVDDRDCADGTGKVNRCCPRGNGIRSSPNDPVSHWDLSTLNSGEVYEIGRRRRYDNMERRGRANELLLLAIICSTYWLNVRPLTG